jgi:hypothetical protein
MANIDRVFGGTMSWKLPVIAFDPSNVKGSD